MGRVGEKEECLLISIVAKSLGKARAGHGHMSPGHPGQQRDSRVGVYLGLVRPGSGCWLRPSVLQQSCRRKVNLYESFAQATQLGDLHTCLMMDMKAR